MKYKNYENRYIYKKLYIANRKLELTNWTMHISPNKQQTCY